MVKIRAIPGFVLMIAVGLRLLTLKKSMGSLGGALGHDSATALTFRTPGGQKSNFVDSYGSFDAYFSFKQSNQIRKGKT